MIDVNTLLCDMVKAIVDNPDEVRVTETVEGDSIILNLNVAEGDVGMVIGKHGNIARSIRTVIKAAAKSTDKKISVEIN